jgi:hypothetical protein
MSKSTLEAFKGIRRLKTKCTHKRIKRNYPFGHNAKPKKKCKDCGKIL